MIFWRIENLKKRLSSKPLTQKESFYYLCAFIGFQLLERTLEGALYGFADTLTWIIYLIMTFLSLLVCYETNGGEKGNNFLEKYISISFVMNIRYFAFLYLPFILFDNFFENDIFYVVFMSIYHVFFAVKKVENFQVFEDKTKNLVK